MKFTSLALASLASIAVSASCISQQTGEDLVNRYAAVIAGEASDIGGPVYTARQIAAPNFVEQSDSANILGGLPLGGPTAASKQVFVQESQANPPFFAETRYITVACNSITWEWIANPGSGAYPVQGIHVFEVDGNNQLANVRFEFNSFANALDNGFTIFYPNGTQYGQ